MFGQLILGPPGAGKTTYCHGLQQLFVSLNRPYLIINLDPGCDGVLPYADEFGEKLAEDAVVNDPKIKEAAEEDERGDVIDIRELIQLQEAMEELKLGPNGGLVYCMEFVEKNLDWVIAQIKRKCGINEKEKEILIDRYLVFDCPGQVELFLHYNVMNNIVESLVKQLDLRLTCVHMVDSHMCVDLSSYLAGVVTSLTATMHLELPHVNVLSKIDLMKEISSDLSFNLEYYLQVGNLRHALEAMLPQRNLDGADKKKILSDEEDEDEFAYCRPHYDSRPRWEKNADKRGIHPMLKKLLNFSAGIAELIEQFNIVSFEPLNVQDKESILRVLMCCDLANGRGYAEKIMDSEENGVQQMAEQNLFAVKQKDTDGAYRDYIERLEETYCCPMEEEEPRAGLPKIPEE